MTSLLSRFFIFLQALPAPIRISALLFFAAGLADGVLMPFFALWAVREAGVPVAAVGLLLACYAGGELIATPFVGGLSDRMGRRPVLIVSTIGVGLGFLILYFSRGTLAAAASLLTIGIFESVLHPTAAAIVADVVPAKDLRRHYGFNRMAASAGDVLGPALGALLVTWSLRGVFLAASLTMFAAAVLVVVGLRETRNVVADEEDDDDLSALGAMFRDRRLAAILIPLAFLEIAMSWVEAVLPLAATQGGALTPAGIGWLFAYAGLVGLVFQMPVLRRCENAAGSRMVLGAGAIFAVTFTVLALAPGFTGFVVAATGIAFTGILLRPLLQALVMEMAPAQLRATYTAALSAVSDLRDAAGPALGTALFALAQGLPWLAGLVLTLAASSALVVQLRGHERKNDDAG
jgi:DHA1 family tetracycline resistance protein-like MFS transporter